MIAASELPIDACMTARNTARSISATRSGLAALVIFMITCGAASAQDAELRGVVRDQSDGLVPGASVTISLATTGFHWTRPTDSLGRYIFSFLAPGSYDVAVELFGFETAKRVGVVLDVGAVVELDVVVTPARLAESVEVSAAAPLDQTPGVGLVIDRSFLENMPLNGRTLQSLILMTPGVVTAPGDGQLSVNGMRTTSNYFTIDGVSANIGVSRNGGSGRNVARFGFIMAGDTDTNAGGANPGFNAVGGTNDIIQLESVQEFRVLTSASSAQYGRQPGGQIQLVTRSGTNRFTGTGFEYFRDSALDAHDWFSNATPSAQRDPLEHHQFGGVFGGPILKNRMFLFSSYEGLRQRQPLTVRQYRVPAMRLRDGPALSPTLLRILNAYPLPQGAEFVDNRGTPLGAAPFYDAPTTRRHSNAYSVKIDRTFGPQLMLSGRWNQGLSDSTGFTLAQRTASATDVRTLTTNARSVVSARLLHEFNLNASQNAADNGAELTDRFGVQPMGVRDLLPAFAPASSMATISLPGNVQDYRVGPSVANRQRQVNLVETLSWNVGRHGMRMGADFRRLTPTYGPTEYRSTATFNSLATMMRNQVDQLSIASSDALRLGVVNFSAYVQDTFRLSGRATLDYGLRWEVNPAAEGLDKPLYTLDGFPDLRALRLAPAGTPLYATRWNKLAPRVGAAYRLRDSAQRSALLRASYGVFYDLGTGATATAARMFPNNRTIRRTNVAYPPTDLAAQPAPALSLDPPYTAQDFTIVGPDNTLPLTHQWSLSAEQAFGTNQRLTATYTGNAGRRLLRRYFYAFEAGARSVNPAFPQARLNITRNDPGWGDSSNHHALQLNYIRRLSRGLQALANYTLARSTDSGSDDATVNLVNNATSPTFYDGYSRSDRRHTFNAAVTYNLPTPKRAARMFGGWSTDYNVRIQSAPPLSIRFAYVDPVDTIAYTYRVDIVPGQPIWFDDSTAPGGRRLNPAAVAVPAGAFGAGSRNAVTHGNEERNGVRGFGSWQADFVLRRHLRLKKDRQTAELRAEFFNVFNNPNFSQADTSIGTVIGATGQFIPNTQFGRPTETGSSASGSSGGLSSNYAAGGARAIQLALRLTF